MNRKFSVAIARFPGGYSEHPASSQWVVDTSKKILADTRVFRLDHWYKSDTPIPMVRNLCVKECLLAEVDYLVMIDRDMAPDLPYPGACPFWDSSWEWMMKRRAQEEAASVPITGDTRSLLGAARGHSAPMFPPATIAAPYCGNQPDYHVYVWDWEKGESDGRAPGPHLAMVSRESAAGRRGIQAAGALPTGLILYDLRIFNRLEPPWFAYEYVDVYQTSKAFTEDVRQTSNACRCGLPQYCNWDAWAGHVKQTTIGKPDALIPASHYSSGWPEPSQKKGHPA